MGGKITQAAEIDLTIKGGDKPKSLREELRRAREEALMLSREFGSFSTEAMAAGKRLANVKEEMEDLGHRVDALNPDKFSRIGTAAIGMSHGFTAAQGAAALFGEQSENVTKSLAKVQGAMALSQGLQGLGHAKQGLLSLGTAIKGPIIKAFSSLRGAIIGTGIGVLVIALGLLIANFDSVKKAVSGFAEKIPFLGTIIKSLGEAWDWLTDVMGDFTDAIGLTDRALDKQISTLEKSNAAAKKQAEVDEVLGKDTYAQRKKLLEDELKLLELNEDDEEKIADKKHEIRLLDAKRTKTIADQKLAEEAKAAEKAKAAADQKLAEEAKAAEKAKAAADKAYQEYKQRSDAATTAEKALLNDLRRAKLTAREKELDDLNLWQKEQAKVLKAGGQKLNDLEALYREKKSKMNAEWDEADKKAAEAAKKAAEDVIKNNIETQLKLVADEFQKTQDVTNTLHNQGKLDLVKQLQDKKITTDQYADLQQEQALKLLNKQILDAKDYGAQTIDLEIQRIDLTLAMEQKAADKKIAIAKMELEMKKQLLTTALDIAENIALLLTNNQKKQAKISKAFALTNIAIDTAQAISALVKNSEVNPANGVTFGLAGIAQFASGLSRIVANIAKAKQLLQSGNPNSIGGGGGGGGGSGSTGIAAPQFQQIGQDIRIQKLNGGNGSSGGTGDGGGIKIPVVEYNDIRKVARRVNILEEASTL